MGVAIVDIGMGNLRSVANAVDEMGFDPFLVRQPEGLAAASHLILPGVGSFHTAAKRLHDSGWVAAIHRHVEAGRPLLGICLGMQLLATWGEEGGGSPGLDLVPGRVVRFDLPGRRVPHVGWNTVRMVVAHPVFARVKPGRDFYFVHSYHFRTDLAGEGIGVTDYGPDFTSVVARGPVLGTQFHPEKSQANGLQIIADFCDWDGTWA